MMTEIHTAPLIGSRSPEGARKATAPLRLLGGAALLFSVALAASSPALAQPSVDRDPGDGRSAVTAEEAARASGRDREDVEIPDRVALHLTVMKSCGWTLLVGGVALIVGGFLALQLEDDESDGAVARQLVNWIITTATGGVAILAGGSLLLAAHLILRREQKEARAALGASLSLEASF